LDLTDFASYLAFSANRFSRFHISKGKPVRKAKFAANM